MKIKITQGKKTISLESDDVNAGVPDTTKDAGANVMELQQDAMLPGNNPNAEFDATNPATMTQVETEATNNPDPADGRANEAVNALFDSIFSLESANPAGDAAGAAETTPAPSQSAEGETTSVPEPGAGEVSEKPGVTEIDLGNGTVVTIDTTGEDNSAPASADPSTAEEPGAASGNPVQSADDAGETSLESFWANLDINKL